ncbi:MAG: spermidine/putrescine ABC transporter substrate-binding protein, partial [Lapillicoccus sp.]
MVDDPVRRDLGALVRRGMSRRQLLGTMGAVGGVAGAGLLTGCAPPLPPASSGAAAPQLPTDLSATDRTVHWANWTAYLDYDDATKTYPTLEAFQKESGLTVTYSEDIEDNDSYFNKVAPQLRAKQDIGRDIVVFTDWMANRVIREQLAQPLEL